MSEPTANRSAGQASNAVDSRVTRGALTNFIGIVAKSLHPAFLILATRLFGPAAVGLYVLATTVIEIASGLVSAGWRDAVLLVGGRHADRDDETNVAQLYTGLGQAVQGVILGSLGFGLLVIGGGAPLLQWLYPTHDVLPLVLVLAPAVPCLALAEIGVAATKALVIMRYDALILGFLKPLMLVITALVAWPLRNDAMGLAIAMLVATAVLPIAAWWTASRHFSLARIARAALTSRPDGKLWAFALPQSANMSLVYLGTGVDVMLLGHFGATSERIAFYATATRVIRNVRQVKLGFSGAFNPVAARLYAERNLGELAAQATTVARWSALVGHPILLLVLAFHVELLGLFDPSWAVPTAFIVLLAAPPWLSNAFGLAGNVLVMAGFSRWNLFNTVLFVGSLLIAGGLLIEPYGLWGAAMAACIASVASPAAQLIQLSRVVGAPFEWRRLVAPNLAWFVGLSCGGGLWWAAIEHDGWLLHVAVAIAAIGGFAIAMVVFGIRPEDRALFGRLGRKR